MLSKPVQISVIIPAFENPHITVERTSEIVLGSALTVSEAVHMATCSECQRRIEKEKELIKAIADFRRRQKDPDAS